MHLREKTVLVAGASSGIGRALAIALAKRNNRVVVTARRKTLLDELVAEIEESGGEALAVAADALAGFLGLPMQGPYSAAKAAARILMDTCRIELRNYNLKFVSVHPGFVKTETQLEYDQPMPMALSEEQAANHMVRAIERGGSDYMFPWVYKMLIKLAGILPKRLLGRILLLDLPEEYGQAQ